MKSLKPITPGALAFVAVALFELRLEGQELGEG
jgi:hypothetical protein